MDNYNLTCDKVLIKACVSYENCSGSVYIPVRMDRQVLSTKRGQTVEDNVVVSHRFCWNNGLSLQYFNTLNICLPVLLPGENQKKIRSRVCQFDKQSPDNFDITFVTL